MTRRDTIIVAALVNAGLLIVLFVSALKNEDGSDTLTAQIESQQESSAHIKTPQELVFKSEAKRMMGDEVDAVLHQYSQANPLAALPSSSNNSLSETQTKTDTVHSFVEDLKVVTQPKVESLDSLGTVENVFASRAQTPTAQGVEEVVVKKGDVLEKIARYHHTTVADIMKRNGLVSTQLKIGQVLKVLPGVPAVQSSSDIAVTEKKSLDPTSAKYYTVKPGDNPWTIAVKNHMKVEELLKLNNMSEERARKLKPGEKIRIR